MRIHDTESDKSLNEIGLFLTKGEAAELRDALSQLLEESGKSGDHHHVSDQQASKELMVCVYDPSDLRGFNPRSQKLILEDK